MNCFTEQFYRSITDWSFMSARAVVPSLIRLLRPKSVVDVGCGTGIWLAEFLREGVEDVLGVEGPWISEAMLSIPPERIYRHDLTVPLVLSRRFDLVLCMGVAELPPRQAAVLLIATLVKLGAVVLFSAVGLEQNGSDQIKEGQCQSWDRLFAEHGYQPHRGFTARFSGDRDVALRYSRHMVFYAHSAATDGFDLDMRFLDGPPERVKLERIAPVIMTCARDVDLTRQFIDSYIQRIGCALPSPLLSVDLTSSVQLPGRYIALLQRLSPTSVAIHPRTDAVTEVESINDAAYSALSSGLSEIGDRDYLLFLEDDVVFSSQFLTFLSDLSLEKDAGLYTFYQPFSGYGSAVIKTSHFFGTQALLLPKRGVEEILADRRESYRWTSLTYDLRWSRSLALCGFKFYGSLKSYVQHIGSASRYGSASHRSETFVE